MKTKPLNNNVLIEVQLEHDNVARVDANEIMQYGKVIDWSFSPDHLTASAGYLIASMELKNYQQRLKDLVGKTVRWEQYAEGGQTFEEDGKTYALIPFWRLISVTDNEEK